MARAGQKAQLGERIAQLKEEIGGMAAQLQAKDRELQLVKTELDGQHQLWMKKLIADAWDDAGAYPTTAENP